MKFTLKQLEVFCLIAQTGSISNAAEKIFLTQPATSMALKQLEESLGQPLFDRHGKKLILNAFGKQQLQKARQIIEQAKSFSLTTTCDKNLTGDLHIGASRTVGNYIIPKFIAQFKQQHPKVNVHLTIDNTHALKEKMLNFHFDLIVVEGDITADPLIKTQPWKKDRLSIIANSKHPLTKNKSLVAADLEPYAWVIREKGSGTLDLLKKSVLKKIKPDYEIRINGFEAIKQYVAHSECLSLLSESCFNMNSNRHIRPLVIKDLAIERQLTIARHAQKHLSACTQAFMQLLDDVK